ncbi:hypothetical protein KM043_005963 [Ampulex compressa]|nr:hypothetical protein KM043_005963 [Ampulex compressa]
MEGWKSDGRDLVDFEDRLSEHEELSWDTLVAFSTVDSFASIDKTIGPGIDRPPGWTEPRITRVETPGPDRFEVCLLLWAFSRPTDPVTCLQPNRQRFDPLNPEEFGDTNVSLLRFDDQDLGSEYVVRASAGGRRIGGGAKAGREKDVEKESQEEEEGEEGSFKYCAAIFRAHPYLRRPLLTAVLNRGARTAANRPSASLLIPRGVARPKGRNKEAVVRGRPRESAEEGKRGVPGGRERDIGGGWWRKGWNGRASARGEARGLVTGQASGGSGTVDDRGMERLRVERVL